MIARLVAAVVDFAQRNAASVAFAVLALALASGWYAATHLTIDTDLEHLLPINVGWRQDERALDRAFPDNNNLLVAVIDGQTADLADTAARRLSERMRAEPQFFRYVREPDGGPFFDKNGLLFLSPAKLQKVSDELIAAQPLIGSLAHDPSLRGLFATLALFVKNADRDKGAVGRLNPMLAAIAKAIEGELGGRSAGVSWQRLMTGRKPDAGDLRHFVLSVPVLDFAALAPGARAEAELRRLARELQIDPQHGVRLRLTGPVALDDEEFATLRQGAAASTITSVVLVCAILFAALRSARLAGAILATLAAGLSLTAGFAALAIGSLNLISIAFGVLFVGLAVDFSIQFTVCYRDQRHRQGSLSAALSGAAETIGPALLLAAGATAIGFLSFVPTNYTGIRELGWIAGFGMITAIALNFVLLPALLALVGPRGEPEPIGFRRAAPLDRFLLERRSWVLGAAVILALACAALLPRVSFDVDPLDLKNPKSEAVEVARELMKDPLETPYTAEVLAPSLAAAEALARRFDKLPQVAQVITAASFIPQDQRQKLAIIGDLTLLLGPTLSPPTTLPPPGDAEIMASIAACRAALGPLAARDGPRSPAARLDAALDAALARGPASVPLLRRTLLAGLDRRLAMLRGLIDAKPVTLASLPPALRDGWIAPDGRARVEVFPQGDARDPAVLSRFVAAVRRVAPDATGTPVTIQEAGRLISSSFVEAGIIAVAAIAVLLLVVLRRLRDVLLVIAPLLLAAMLTLAIAVAIGIKLNYANILALPLLLGIGVAFDIYFVMNWRAGQSRHLQSSTARAIVFSALTTIAAFGSLALSPDPGTADMGELLTLSLVCTLFCTLFVLPALLGPARQAARAVPRPQPRHSRIGPPRAVSEMAPDPGSRRD
ncbi:MAG TPA: MMPL family transporter [Stellaceae bacterium]|nr:MMPL family transporter [Stellaceae bacterium]